MSPGPHLWILLGSTFVLSALWAAILLVLVRVRESGSRAEGGSHVAVELGWAVVPVLLVLSVVVPTLQAGLPLPGAGDAAEVARVAEDGAPTSRGR